MVNKEQLLKSVGALVDTFTGSSKIEVKEVAKEFKEDQKIFTAVVLVPEVEDAHGHIYGYDVVEDACHQYVEKCMNQNVQHLIEVEKSEIAVIESYIAPADFTLGKGEVLKGSWVMSAKIHNDALWDMCKDGTFTGWSVGCNSMITVEDV